MTALFDCSVWKKGYGSDVSRTGNAALKRLSSLILECKLPIPKPRVLIACRGWTGIRKPARRFLSLLLVTLLVSGWMSGRGWSQEPAPELDPPGISAAVEGVATLIEENYFDPTVAETVARSLRQLGKEGSYSQFLTREELAQRMTHDLFTWTHDKHLAVMVIPPSSGEVTPVEPEPSRAEIVRRTNAGLQRVEILAGNVGYLQLNAFYRVEEASERISAAMQLLASADALIVDLRENLGGAPDTVALLASYFFDSPNRPLFDIVPRGEGGRKSYQTSDVEARLRNSQRPVYVLTSAQTFSAGEGLAYLLQEQGRAVIIGEPTAGAANPGRPYPVDAHLEVVVPNGQIRSAIRDSNWEGAGVSPDCKVAAREALSTAHRQALEALIQSTADLIWRKELERHLQTLESTLQP